MCGRRLATVFLGFALGFSLNAQEPPVEGPPLPGKAGFGRLPAPPLNGFQIVPLRKESPLDQTPTFHLAPRGWHDLSLRAPQPLKRPTQKGLGEATVEVWDLPLPASAKEQAFRANLDAFQQRLTQAMLTPPPQYGDLDLAHLMLSDPGQPQALELARVRSVHVRFNRLPPNGTLPR